MADEPTLRERFSPPLVVVGIFALALFLRSYFAYGLAMEDFLLSGGSDAFYFGWILDNILATGEHFVQDRMLNYPLGMANPRPPLYAWSVALSGLLLGHLQGNVAAGLGQAFLFSTAFWGALTVFPTYLLTKEMFGRRTGYVAAFFLAVMAAHIQRTPLSNGDHDALFLFFVVTAFYFFLRALSELREKTWVQSWLRPRQVVRGIRTLVTENRRPILLAIMAGASVGAVALTWKGYPYAVVILIAYFLLQLLVHKVRNRDPLGVILVFGVTLSTAFLLALPYYASMGFLRTWFDVPLYLFLAALGVGLLFAVVHRLPWLLVIPPILLGFGLGTTLAALYSPTVAQALGTGFGYFVRTKVFETIAEAQPPTFSQGMLSFGPVTAFLSFAGLVLMAREYVRRPRPDFLFAFVWMGAAIFMAMSAARFLFNASPAFAITSAWVTVLLAEKLGLDAIRRTVSATGGSKWVAFRKEVKVRHVAVTLVIVFLLILPNTWYAVDAASPFEVKDELDQQVLRVTPEPLRPRAAEGQGPYYFGAFGFSLPLKSRYFPAAWDWLRQQDADVHPLWDRPAFLSWWDYGFEAIQEGRHPAVADNFQNGIPVAGHFLAAQGENEAIAILSVRLLQGDQREHGGLSSQVRAALAARGLDVDRVAEAMSRPAVFIPAIRAEPERFGQWDERLRADNAQIIYLKTVLTEELALDEQATLYRDLRQATGRSILYAAVDSRLIPFSGRNTGIFYAPMKLSDHVVRELPDGRSIPTQFYRLVATTPAGEFDVGDLPPGVQIQDIRIEYRDMFYESMAYRIFFGPRGQDVGVQEDGLPGLSGQQMQGVQPQQGWMLRHFRLVYKTAYFNPFPPEEVANHSDAWRAVNYFDALDLEQQIRAGERVGTVDLSPASSLRQGVVFLKYYDGALLEGRVATEAGRPLEGVRITVLDEAGIPHEVATTDARGRYDVLLPFGEVQVVASVGSPDPATGIGATVLGQTTLLVTEDQALRKPQDMDGDGRPDYLLEHSFAIPGASVEGEAFLDVDGDEQRGPGDVLLSDLEVRVEPRDGAVLTAPTDADGRFRVSGLLPGPAEVVLVRAGTPVARQEVTLSVGQEAVQDLRVPGATVRGTVHDEFDQPAPGATVLLREESTGEVRKAVANASGAYRFRGLFPGTYALDAVRDGAGLREVRFAVTEGALTERDLRLEPLGQLTVRSLVAFSPAPHVTFLFQRRGDDLRATLATDASARFTTQLPLGVYDAYALHWTEEGAWSFLGSVTVREGSQSLDLSLQRAHRVNGTVRDAAGDPLLRARVTFAAGETLRTVVTTQDGAFATWLPGGDYRAWVLTREEGETVAFQLTRSRVLDFSLQAGIPAILRVFRDLNGNGSWDPGEGLEGIRVAFARDDAAFAVFSGEEGRVEVPLRAGQSYTLAIDEPGYEPVAVGPLPAEELATQEALALRARPVPVSGVLTGPEGTDLADRPVAFEALGAGAESVNVSSRSDGSFAASLVPGHYRVRVDDPLTANGTVRLQDLQGPDLRVPVGRSPAELTLPLAVRYQVEGRLEVDGAPFQGLLTFRGPEEATVEVDGDYRTFLQQGNYTALALTDDRLFLEALSVTSAPTNLSGSLQNGVTLLGTLQVDGQVLGQPVELTFTRTSDGAARSVTSDGGAYQVLLPPATYRVTGTWEGVDRLDGPLRFVRYALNTTVAVSGDLRKDLPFDRALNNATLHLRVLRGDQLVSAALTLRAANETAIATAASGASVTLAVAPGVYDLYAFRDSGKSVALTRITVDPTGSTAADVPLVAGIRVAGVASLEDGTRRRTDLRFAATATAAFATDAEGMYEVYLPAGTYRLEATAQRVERGLQVEYRGTASLDLRESAILNPTLERVVRRGVVVDWDRAQRTRVDPGGTVTYTLDLRNAGNVPDTYVLSGLPEGWDFVFQPQRVTLPFGEGNRTTVTVRIAAPADALVDHAPLLVTAQSTAAENVLARVRVELDVAQFRGLALSLGAEPPTRDPRGLTYQVDLVNEGNGQDRYTLVLENPDALREQGWAPAFLRDGERFPTRVTNLTVDARDSATVTLRLEVAGPEVGTPRIALRAFSQEAPSLAATLEIPVTFPSLAFQRDRLVLEGEGLTLGPQEFPLYLYGLLAASAVAVTLLLLRYGRRRRWR